MSGKKIKVLLRGEPRWVPVLLDELTACDVSARKYQGPRIAVRNLDLKAIVNLLNCNIFHQVYITQQPSMHSFFKYAKWLGKRIVAHWIGSDIIELQQYVQKNGHIPKELKTCVDVHLADSPELKTELAEFGLFSEVVRLIPRSVEAAIMSMPVVPAVLSYWSDLRAEFYRCDIIKALAERFHEIPFYIAGTKGYNLIDMPKNVIFMGNVDDIDSIYGKVSVLVRIVEHDSLSAMVLEMLARGRYVIYNQTFVPHTHIVKNLEQAINCLRKVLKYTVPNKAGADYVRENFSWRDEIKNLKNIYQAII